MSGLVNYSSEEDQDDYQYTKAGERERSGRSTAETVADSGSRRQLKKHYRERSKSSSSSGSSSDNNAGGGYKAATPPRKEKISDGGKSSKRSKSGNATNNSSTTSGSYNDEDKYKSDKRSEKYREQHHRDKRDGRGGDAKFSKDSRGSRDFRDDHGNVHYHDIKKFDDSKRYSKDNKRDNNKRDSNSDHHRDDKRSRYDDKKMHTSSSFKDRYSSSSTKSRYDDKKSYADRNDDRRDEKQRMNDDRRNSGNNAHRRCDYDDRKDRRNMSDDRRSERSYSSTQDRSNSHRSSQNKYQDRRTEEDHKQHHQRSDSIEKSSEKQQNSSHREYAIENRPEESKSSSSPDVVPEKKVLPSARNFEALLSLPLSETAPKQPNIITVPLVTASATTETTATTVQLPSYYNPKVINASKYAQQMQKRKLIWGAKKTEDVAAKWGHAQFSQDSDGKVASKFMRLMGIKNSATEANASDSGEKAETSPSSSTSTNKPDYKSREAMFSTMEQQYEVARQVTHTMRGVGLGFSSQNRPY